jgi:anti-sigma factor RsiW
MDYEAQLKLQAFVDGELPEAEAKHMANLVERDSDAGALAAELRQMNSALSDFEAELRLPETREFFWSKVERDIRSAESKAAEPVKEPFHLRLRRFLMPVTGLALVAFAGLVVVQQNGSTLIPGGVETETALSDAGAFTYRDYSAGTTLVWLSYPAENDLADDEGIGTLPE